MTKFYKITNENECHNGLQYHDGLVEDILPYNPSGDCEEGGIYFASKDIMAFLLYGPWIREVTLPDGEEYYTNPGEPVKYKAHRVILGPRKRWGDPAVIQALMDDGCDPSTDNNCPIRQVAEYGYLEIVKLLLADKRVDPSDNNNDAIQGAAYNGHTEIVKLLLADKRVDPSDGDNFAIRRAAKNGHTEIVRLLLADKRVDPRDFNNQAIRHAAKNGHTEVVKLLLDDPRVDPTADYNFAIQYAFETGYLETVQLLKDYYVKNGLTIPSSVL